VSCCKTSLKLISTQNTKIPISGQEEEIKARPEKNLVLQTKFWLVHLILPFMVQQACLESIEGLTTNGLILKPFALDFVV
jgi:hypothetical protein